MESQQGRRPPHRRGPGVIMKTQTFMEQTATERIVRVYAGADDGSDDASLERTMQRDLRKALRAGNRVRLQDGREQWVNHDAAMTADHEYVWHADNGDRILINRVEKTLHTDGTITERQLKATWRDYTRHCEE